MSLELRPGMPYSYVRIPLVRRKFCFDSFVSRAAYMQNRLSMVSFPDPYNLNIYVQQLSVQYNFKIFTFFKNTLVTLFFEWISGVQENKNNMSPKGLFRGKFEIECFFFNRQEESFWILLIQLIYVGGIYFWKKRKKFIYFMIAVMYVPFIQAVLFICSRSRDTLLKRNIF